MKTESAQTETIRSELVTFATLFDIAPTQSFVLPALFEKVSKLHNIEVKQCISGVSIVICASSLSLVQLYQYYLCHY